MTSREKYLVDVAILTQRNNLYINYSHENNFLIISIITLFINDNLTLHFTIITSMLEQSKIMAGVSNLIALI